MPRKIEYKRLQKLGKFGILYIKENRPVFEPLGTKRREALVKCPCGRRFNARINSVKLGLVKNCGCSINNNYQRHGLTGHKVRKCWLHIKNRCLNKKYKRYNDWGGRGINIYKPWITNVKLFYNYVIKLEHYGEVGRSLDRIDNNGNYEPGNLRWATYSEQRNNQRKDINRKSIK